MCIRWKAAILVFCSSVYYNIVSILQTESYNLLNTRYVKHSNWS